MRLYIMVCLCLLLLSCSRDFSIDAPDKELIPLSKAEIELVQDNHTFAAGFFKQIAQADPAQNIFVSPLSASIALAMTYNGAAGETEAAMRKALGFADMDREQLNQALQHILQVHYMKLKKRVILH